MSVSARVIARHRKGNPVDSKLPGPQDLHRSGVASLRWRVSQRVAATVEQPTAVWFFGDGGRSSVPRDLPPRGQLPSVKQHIKDMQRA